MDGLAKITDVKKFLSTEEHPLTMEEFMEFWHSLTDEETLEFKKQVTELTA